MSKKNLNAEQHAALREFAEIHGRKWKQALSECWITGRDADSLPSGNGCYLRQIRNIFGPSWLAAQPVKLPAEPADP